MTADLDVGQRQDAAALEEADAVRVRLLEFDDGGQLVVVGGVLEDGRQVGVGERAALDRRSHEPERVAGGHGVTARDAQPGDAPRKNPM